MANKKISELTAATTPLVGTELVEIVQGGENRKVAASNIGGTSVSDQATANTGTNDTQAITPLKLKNLDRDSAAITDASSMALTGPKHTLTTSSATRTFTISHTGDEIDLLVTLNATSSVFTFPAAALCSSEGIASGDNTLSIGGTSGDKYQIGIKKMGSTYVVLCKNIGQ